MEKNKVIAEFMGFIPILEEDFLSCNHPHKRDSEDFKRLFIYDRVEDINDWNWLMEVVAKILSLNRFGNPDYLSLQNMPLSVAMDIQHVYTKAFHFIEWYNKQN